MMVTIVSILVQIFGQDPQAYTCHRWSMHPDQSITCENGERFQRGFYRFERGSKGLVAIVEPGASP